ncbi:hypothetical protein [Helicobacter rodentium]|uniref:hypothetical protein n=1 Tax=Helicobacter rodentium TaxID=59617 RepID=UPI0025A65F34|nr:hypothetical protein [Helicobacter rodentium]
MKKLILGFLLIFGISSTLFAEVDFIALATNGEFNEQSAGVKVLNDEEMRQVVGGGAYVKQDITKQYGVVNNSGQNIYYTAYYKVELEAGDSAYFNLGSNYYAAVATTYNFQTNTITDEVVKINANNSNDVQTINLQSNVKGRITNYSAVRSWIQQDKINIKYFK